MYGRKPGRPKQRWGHSLTRITESRNQPAAVTSNNDNENEGQQQQQQAVSATPHYRRRDSGNSAVSSISSARSVDTGGNNSDGGDRGYDTAPPASGRPPGPRRTNSVRFTQQTNDEYSTGSEDSNIRYVR